MKAYCLNCDSYNQITETFEDAETYINDVKISYKARTLLCSECGEEIVDKNIVEENLQKAHDIYKNMEKS